jgi:hypothetical protein
MFFILLTLLPVLATIALMIGAFRLSIWAAPKLLRFTLGGLMPHQPAKPSTGMNARFNPLRLGQNAAPATSLNTILLRTTPGVRLWAVAINIFITYILWATPGTLIPAGLPSIALSLFGAIGCLNIYLYEARVEDDRLITQKWGLFRREYLWRDLTSAKDDKGYDYILHFDKTDVRVPKYLVGAQGFLTFVTATLEGNHARHARTPRS